MENLMKIFSTWAVIGYFLILVFPKPKTKMQGIVQLLISGPIGWVIFIPASIEVLLKNRSTT